MTVEQDGDSDETRALKRLFIFLTYFLSDIRSLERILILEAERDHAQRQVAEIQAKGSVENNIAVDLVSRPPVLRSFKVAQFREMLGLGGPEHKMEWNAIRVRYH